MKKKFILSMAVLLGALTFTACSSDNDDNGGNEDNVFSIVTTSPIVDNDTYPENTTAANYSNKAFGNNAIDACEELERKLANANTMIASTKLSATQEAYLYQVLQNLVDNVIVPTYTDLADDVEHLEKTLHGLTVSTIKQAQINQACEDF